MSSDFDQVGGFAIGLMALIVLAAVAAWLLLLYVAFATAHEYLFLVQEEDGTPPLAAPPTSMFGAPRDNRWIEGYYDALYYLSELTGMEYVSTETRLLSGIFVLTQPPALALGLIAGLLIPQAGFQLVAAFVLLGIIITLVTARKMAQPARGWFEFNRESQGDHDDNYTYFDNEDTINLGDDGWFSNNARR